MPVLSSAAWVAHDVGLATSIGGSLYGKAAFHPALAEAVRDTDERRLAADAAWRRFGWINLAAHAAYAVPWLIGRTMLSGREASGAARQLTLAKDILVGVSLVSGIASVLLGRLLGKKVQRREDAAQLNRAVGVVGAVNLAANVGVLGTTALLAMESSESGRFALTARKLP